MKLNRWYQFADQVLSGKPICPEQTLEDLKLDG